MTETMNARTICIYDNNDNWNSDSSPLLCFVHRLYWWLAAMWYPQEKSTFPFVYIDVPSIFCFHAITSNAASNTIINTIVLVGLPSVSVWSPVAWGNYRMEASIRSSLRSCYVSNIKYQSEQLRYDTTRRRFQNGPTEAVLGFFHLTTAVTDGILFGV